MAGRKADMFAQSKGSLAYKLRKRRELMEQARGDKVTPKNKKIVNDKKRRNKI